MTWKIDKLCDGRPAKGHSPEHFYHWERHVSVEFPEFFKFVRLHPTSGDVVATGFCQRHRSDEFHLSTREVFRNRTA
jgi:hypothetical protein